ncbi:MAG: hypothetical protein Ct9H300mP21_09340 [Pseudomonadota bacterium]|nr:MAG: hypothetical protein Ct9H300mP21_09340 [Pseudomonadota bacterium]
MKGKLAVVEKQLRRIQEKHPLNPEALQLQADLYKSRGNSAQAEKLLRQAILVNDSLHYIFHWQGYFISRVSTVLYWK